MVSNLEENLNIFVNRIISNRYKPNIDKLKYLQNLGLSYEVIWFNIGGLSISSVHHKIRGLSKISKKTEHLIDLFLKRCLDTLEKKTRNSNILNNRQKQDIDKIVLDGRLLLDPNYKKDSVNNLWKPSDSINGQLATFVRG